MGRVYLGESLTGRRVAVKVIRPDLADDPVFRRRFQREIAAARTVSPLYTAAVVDADTAATAPWFATAYIDGPSVLDHVDAEGPLASGAVLTLAAGLAEALASIHDAGLVHRDLTPGNVILDDSGPHVVDFGIALAPYTTKLTASQMMVGTPSYIAPEVIEGNEAGPPGDVFSLGATLAFAASGRHLVAEGPMHAQILQITRGRFDLEPVPKELRPLIVRCVSVNTRDRPTASELVRILVGGGAAKPTRGWYRSRATATSIKVPTSPRISRRRLLAIGGASGVVLAGAGAAAWAGAFTPAPETSARSRPRAIGSPTPLTPAPAPSGPGTIAWRARSGVMPVGLSSAGPQSPTRIVVDHGARLIGANSAEVFEVQTDGTRLWTRSLPTGLVTLWSWGDAVLASDSRRLWLIDAGSGAVRFVINAADDEKADSQGDNPDHAAIQITGVVLAAQAAFVGLNTATIAFDRRGRRLWRRARPSPRNGVRPGAGVPIATDGRWLVTHEASGAIVNLALRDARDGALQWLAQYEPAPAGPPPAGPGGPGGSSPPPDEAWSRSEGRITDRYLVIREVQEVRVVTMADGELLWRGASPTPIAGIELAGSTILVAADRLRAYEVATQAQRWDYDARGARVGVTPGGTRIFVASDQGLSLVDADGHELWSNRYPAYLLDAGPDWAGVQGDLGFVTFRARDPQRNPLDFDTLAVNLGIA
jgi:hypothetical protein